MYFCIAFKPPFFDAHLSEQKAWNQDLLRYFWCFFHVQTWIAQMKLFPSKPASTEDSYDLQTFRFIIIIIMCRQHEYSLPSLAISPYRSSPLADLQGYIPYPHRAAVCMFELVILLLLGHMWGSIGVYYLWAHPCFSSSVLHVWFV